MIEITQANCENCYPWGSDFPSMCLGLNACFLWGASFHPTGGLTESLLLSFFSLFQELGLGQMISTGKGFLQGKILLPLLTLSPPICSANCLLPKCFLVNPWSGFLLFAQSYSYIAILLPLSCCLIEGKGFLLLF